MSQPGRSWHSFYGTRRRRRHSFLQPILYQPIAALGTGANATALMREEAYRNKSLDGKVRTVCKQGRLKEALDNLRIMDQQGVRPDPYAYAALLQGCFYIKALPQGKLIHAHIIQTGLKPDIFLGTKLVIMYANCGSLLDARRILDTMPKRNVVLWTTMIAAYARHGHGGDALTLFYQMQQTGIQPDQFALASILPVCGNLAALEHGKEVHEDIITSGFQSDTFLGNALVDMYSKCGSAEDARKVFDKMLERDVVSWTAMIAGYTQNGHFDEALKLFQQMKLTDVKPNSVTLASVLPACANLAALQQGKEAHEDIIRSGFQSDVFVGGSLVDMYAKCGSLEDARRVFEKMAERDVVAWTAMIVGYGMHGYGKEALQLFEQMQLSGTKPDHVTFVGVLSACCHAGLVDDGWEYFLRMSRDCQITPAMEHYCCMVGLLGRAGHLDEAQNFISNMPIRPNAAIWASLLGACAVHGNLELGERVAKHLLELDPQNSAHYVLLSNIYAMDGRWNDREKVIKMMKDRSVKRTPGCSWIEVNNKMYGFAIGHKSYPQAQEIHGVLERLSGQMKEAGYVPKTDFVLHDVEEEQKEHIICHHSEKLAIAFGLINISHGMPIRIVKNLRVCGDCHSATKFISKIVAGEIVVRDANRFHHFKDGWCSCGDYW